MKYSSVLKSWFVTCTVASMLVSAPVIAGSSYVGMQPQELTTHIMAALGLDAPSGVIIRNVGKTSPAHDAGIIQGDVILTINGKEIETLMNIVEVVKKSKPGDVLKITLFRIGQKIDVELVVGDWDKATRARKNTSAQLGLLGLTVISLTDKIREQFNVRWDVEGVVLSIVDPTKGMSGVLERGDVIIQANQKNIWLASQFIQAYEQARSEARKHFLMLVLRDSKFVFVVIPVR